MHLIVKQEDGLGEFICVQTSFYNYYYQWQRHKNSKGTVEKASWDSWHHFGLQKGWAN